MEINDRITICQSPESLLTSKIDNVLWLKTSCVCQKTGPLIATLLLTSSGTSEIKKGTRQCVKCFT